MAADFNKPTNSSSKTVFLTESRDNISAVAKMDFTGASNIPANSVQWNHTTRNIERENGSGAFISFGGPCPAGSIVMYGAASAPTGWLLCDGTAVSRTTYADLFAIIGTTFGVGNGTTTFNLPDFRQKFPIGKAASGTGATLGGTGGAIDHTHTVPAHYHGMGTGADLNITSGGAHTHSIDHDHGSVTSGGESTPHNHSIAHDHGAFTSAAAGSTTQQTAAAWVGSGTPGGDISYMANYIVGGATAGGTVNQPWGGHTHSIDVPNYTGNSGNDSNDHTHAVDLPNYTGTSGSTSHTHTSGTFSGSIGLVTGGVNGNASMTSGTNNPPFLSVNFIVKY
jgi:microcystin-dependent protein